MPRARGLTVALSILAACDARSQSAPGEAEPPALMERTVEPEASQTAARRESSLPAPEARSGPASSEAPAAYDRKLWPHWIDADRDCQDARTEVLIAESFERVEFEDARRCEIARGRWQCPYTGNVVTEVHLLDVDHLVPLANAHRSGAASWTEDRRRRYANDLEHPEHLVAVEYKANRSKGDKGPEAWLPPLEDARCPYVRDWVAIKRRWGLRMAEAEAAAVADALELCAAGRVPPLPQARDAGERRSSKPAAKPSASQCCRICKQGKACGDSCIAKTSTCTKPPGCACDG